MTAVSVGGLVKAYGQVKALKDVSLDVMPGELFCISGPDAAGNSTLLRIPAGTLKLDQPETGPSAEGPERPTRARLT